MRDDRGKGLLFAFSLLPFILLATLNSAGYRYGASDQAFYIPAVLLRLDPTLYPRDRAVLDAQAPLQWADEIVAGVSRATGLGVPELCAALYVVTLILLASAAWLLGRSLYRSPWTAAGLLAALTLRHAVPDSGTNTLEGYFHPRQLAFAFGALAAAAFVRRRPLPAVLLLAAAAMLHPTTTVWFAIWLGVAAFVAERRLRLPVLAAGIAGAAAALWAIAAGPLAARLVIMDPEWLASIGTKEYLFPLEWSWDAWIVNLAYAPVIVWVHRRRMRAGVATPHERGLVIGCLALLLVFAIAVPLNIARLALAIQLQPGRIFWLLDLLAVIYVTWAIAEGARGTVRRAQAAVALLVLASVLRGAYLKFVLFPDRPVAEIFVRDDDWGRAMRWAQTTEPDSAWLAHPAHAARYGTSLRLAGRRDVLVEAMKDGALGMYDRRVAMRTRERVEALAGFEALTPADARALAGRYDLDYLVTEQPLDLPEAFASGRLRVYDLRPR
jgi:hypothetical protein